MSPSPDRGGGRRRRDQLRDAVLRAVYRAGWASAAHLPEPLVHLLARAAARLAVRVGGRHVTALRRNLTLATGRPASDRLVRAGVASYLRTFWEVLALPGWSEAETLDRVRTEDEHWLRDAVADAGAVVALPHSGNWDLAGAWACRTGMPVSTVAEQLGEAEFAAFVSFRQGLGLEVLSHRDPGALSALAAAVRRGRLVCLVADRDLDGRGVPVRWRDQPVRMPAGPAVVARRTGAALVPAVCSYEGRRMVIRFGPPVPPRPGRAGLVAMTQQVADFFADPHRRAAAGLAPAAAVLRARGGSGMSLDLGRPLRIGLVCPYSLDRPGGVQNHVLGLAAHLRDTGHEPFVLAPGTADHLPDADLVRRFTSAGPAVPVPYNGSVARVNFGPVTAARVRRWLGDGFDVLHLHEPVTPSVSLLALRAASGPVVATFHTATPRSRSMQLAGGVLRGAIDKIEARVAVSEPARRVVTRYLHRDAAVIPNGFRAADFTPPRPRTTRWRGGHRPRLVFLGRVQEPRKGLDVLLAALPAILAARPDLEVVVAGHGHRPLPAHVRRESEVSDARRAALLASADVFVAPHTARESFGIVLLEALASGAPVVASDLPAFTALLQADRADPGSALGSVFPAGDARALAAAVTAVLDRPDEARAARGWRHAQRYDWACVGPEVVEIYRAVVDPLAQLAEPVPLRRGAAG